MASPLDELFSPDKLRHRWENTATPTLAEYKNASHSEIQTHYLKLQTLITQKFPTKQVLWSESLTFLDEQIKLTFDLKSSVSANLGQKNALIILLENLEELVWAMELQQKDE